MANIEKYRINNSKKILKYLNLLLDERCLISASFGKDEKDTFLSAIVNIDEKNNSVSIDCGPQEYLNKKLLGSPFIKCSSKYKGIKVLFQGSKVSKAGKPGNPEFLIAVPNNFYWMERRQYFRVKSPISKNNYCSISFTKTNTEEQTSYKLKLFDISANGLSFLCDSDECSEKLSPSVEIKNCKLFLENEDPLEISIEVKNNHPLNPNMPEKTRRIGCLIAQSSLKVESTILRHMQDLERELILKER